MNAQVDRIREQLEVDDMDHLHHMLGMKGPRKSWGYRNRYCPGPLAVESMERMRALGVVEKLLKPDGLTYRATRLGCQVAGLPAHRIAEALS